jgi:hypothetical protein
VAILAGLALVCWSLVSSGVTEAAQARAIGRERALELARAEAAREAAIFQATIRNCQTGAILGVLRGR